MLKAMGRFAAVLIAVKPVKSCDRGVFLSLLFTPKQSGYSKPRPHLAWFSRPRMDLNGASGQHEFGYQWQMVGEAGPVVAARVPVRVLRHELAGAVQAACVDVV